MDRMSYRNQPAPRSHSPETSEAKPAESSPAPQTTRKHFSNPRPRRSKLPWLIAAIVALLAVAGAVHFFLHPSGEGVDKSKFQAVFLTNGQVYFGKLSPLNSEYIRLKNVYYLQNKSDTAKTTPQSAASANATDVELIKLGGEIHGPSDEMLVAKDQILFFENLKSDGKVSQTIANYQKQHQ